jgi:ribosomal protein S10
VKELISLGKTSPHRSFPYSANPNPDHTNCSRPPKTLSPLNGDKFDLSSETDDVDDTDDGPRLPRAVQAIYLKPLKRRPEYGLPVCDLQLRSYSVRNLEFFADFALRAAYYLNLPASGPVPLPRITNRWTVPKSNFIYKKSQENFERITLRRLIQIKDGDLEVVQTWLAFLRRHAYYGVGMKANVWEFESLGKTIIKRVSSGRVAMIYRC